MLGARRGRGREEREKYDDVIETNRNDGDAIRADRFAVDWRRLAEAFLADVSVE